MTLPPTITLARLSVDPASREAALSVLSAEESARMASFRHDERRGAFAVGRLAARTLVGRRLGCSPRDVVLRVREDGSVAVADGTLHLSISHSGREVAVVTGEHPVAVDLERIKPRPTALYRFMLRPDETDLPGRLPDPDEGRIALLWAIKESVLKGRRTGLRHSPKSLRIGFGEPADGTAILQTGSAVVRADDGEAWNVGFALEPACALAVAWPSPHGVQPITDSAPR